MQGPTLEERVTLLEAAVIELKAKGAQQYQPRKFTGSTHTTPQGEFFSEYEGGAGIPRVAPEAELFGQYGDLEIKFDPKPWVTKGGQSYVGAHYSQCPPDYLRAVVGLELWKAKKNYEERKMSAQGKPIWLFCLRAASKAEGWASFIEKQELASGPVAAPVRTPDPAWVTEECDRIL